MFASAFVAGVAYVASPIPRLVCMEVVEALCPMLRQRSSIAVMRVKAVVDVAVKAAMAVKPGASSKEDPSNKPVGPIVAIRSTVIRRIVEVPVRADGGRPNVYTNRNLGVRHWYGTKKGNSESGGSERVNSEHGYSLIESESTKGRRVAFPVRFF
jgi:hypothetical protein